MTAHFRRIGTGIRLMVGCMLLIIASVPTMFVRSEEPQDGGGEAKKASPERISHNDGTAEGKKSVAGAAEFLSFTLPNEGAKVAAIRVHGARYGTPQPPEEDFSIYFLNKDLSQTLATKTAPYGRFKRGPESWVEIKFPEPVEVPSDFWVGVDFHAEQKKGIYLSVDKSTDGSHSRVGQPGKTIRPANIGGDWMIEVVLAK
jgi:hypothetical protein